MNNPFIEIYNMLDRKIGDISTNDYGSIMSNHKQSDIDLINSIREEIKKIEKEYNS